MTLMEIIWPWGALKRERAAKWAVIGECNDARHEADRYRRSFEELADDYERLGRNCNVLLGRVTYFENAIHCGLLVKRDPKTGRMMKRGAP